MLNSKSEIVKELLAAHGCRLYRLLMRLTRRPEIAEDLLQELMLRMLKSNGLLASRHPHRYAIRSAINLAFEWRRQQHCVVGPLTTDVPDIIVRAGDEIEHREALDALLEAVGRLRPNLQQVIVLRYLEGRSCFEIAEMLGKSTHQIRGLCYRGITLLRQHLTGGFSHAKTTERSRRV